MKRRVFSKNFILSLVPVCALAISVLFPNLAVAAKEETFETQAEVFIEESLPQDSAEAEQLGIADDLVDAPPVVPEGSAADNNIFGVEGMYYVTIPKKMAFRVLSNGDYETVESSRYTVNSALDSKYQLSVRVGGSNTDKTMQLTNEDGSIHRKVEVSTQAYDVWKYRPDGTKLITNESDALGYGKELVLVGPGKFFAKCRLSRFGDDEIHAGKWSGTILFTVSCTPDPEAGDVENNEESLEVEEEAIEEVDEEEVAGESGGGSDAADASDVAGEGNPAAQASEMAGGVEPADSIQTNDIASMSAPAGESASGGVLSEAASGGEPNQTASGGVPGEAVPDPDEPVVLDDGALMDFSQIEEETGEGTSETSEDIGSPLESDEAF